MKTIGILGGLGPESTILYYRYITQKYYETHRNYAYPQIVIYSVNFQEFIDTGYETAPKVKEAIKRLHRAGADFAVAACNSVHIVYDQVSKTTPIPWISIMDVTAEAITARGLSKVGLLGTIFTMSKGFYQKALARHGIETITPDSRVQKTLNGIIYGELVRNVVKKSSQRFVLKCVDDLSKQGAQGVILGCTELPFAARQADTSVPLFDTAALHAQRALDLAMAEPRLPRRNLCRKRARPRC